MKVGGCQFPLWEGGGLPPQSPLGWLPPFLFFFFFFFFFFWSKKINFLSFSILNDGYWLSLEFWVMALRWFIKLWTIGFARIKVTVFWNKEKNNWLIKLSIEPWKRFNRKHKWIRYLPYVSNTWSDS
jgi:hypothetical protein